MNKFSLKLKPKFFPLLLNLFIVLVFVWLAVAPQRLSQAVLNRLNYMLYDAQINLLLRHPQHPQYPIAIVDIDESSLQQEGRWPWPRDKVSQLVQKLAAQGVKIIAFDVLFAEPEVNIATDLSQHLKNSSAISTEILRDLQKISMSVNHDILLAKTLAENQDVVILGVFLSSQPIAPLGALPPPLFDLKALPNTVILPHMQSYIGNLPLLQKAAIHGGAISIIPDDDGVIRRYALIQRYQDRIYPSLALEAVRLYLQAPPVALHFVPQGREQIIDALHLGTLKINVDKSGSVFISYRGGARIFPYYSATDVLNDRVPANQLKNALVFVGTSAVGLSDMRSTPLQNVYPGVEIHATIAEGLLSQHIPFMPGWAPGAEVVLIILLGLVLAISFLYLGPFGVITVTVILLAGIFGGSLWLRSTSEMVLPIVLPMLMIIVLAVTNMAMGFFLETRRRSELRRAFEQYVPTQLVAQIMRNPQSITGFAGDRKIMTVLFMDIRDFTSMAEQMSINDLKRFLNLFLTEMTKVIFKHGGTVDKYVGDMVIAFWGAPLSDTHHAHHAVAAGLDMLAVTAKLKSELVAKGLPTVRIGVGVNTGWMDVGDMGSSFRRAYTVIGDAVNLGSRLEHLTKYYGVGMIVGQDTYEAVAASQQFVFRQLDKVNVKGKKQIVTIYQPLGLRENFSAEQLAELQQYEKALATYYQRDWRTAEQLFKQLHAQFPDELLYRRYAARLRIFLREPPAEDWDGVWRHYRK